MNRRGFFALVAGLLASPKLPVPATLPPEPRLFVVFPGLNAELHQAQWDAMVAEFRRAQIDYAATRGDNITNHVTRVGATRAHGWRHSP